MRWSVSYKQQRKRGKIGFMIVNEVGNILITS